MARDQDYFEKKAQDDEQFARFQESLKALEDTRLFHEKSREQSMRYFDKQREDQLFHEMIEKAKLDTKPITPELRREIEADYGQWLDDRRKAFDNYKAADGTKAIAPGTMATFDKKAAEIVEKGNVHTSVPFLNEARQLAAEKYAAFENKQAAYDLEIERATAEGDPTAAQILEARKDYEATAYERDTAQSVLAKYEVLYGTESRNYKEQIADVEQLTMQADDLYAKLEAVTDADARLRKALQSETLMIEHMPEQGAVGENSDAAEDVGKERNEARAAMMGRLRDRIKEARQGEPADDKLVGIDDGESDIAESASGQHQDDEVIIENPEILDGDADAAEKIEKERQEEEERLRRLKERVSEEEDDADGVVVATPEIDEPDPQEEQDRQQETDREVMEALMQDLELEPEAAGDEEEVLNWTEDRLQKEMPSEESQSPMMDRLRDRIEDAKQDEAFEAGWQEFMSGDDGPPTTDADDAEARADAVLRDMDEGRDPYSDGYDDFEARQAAAEADLEHQAYGDPDHDALDADGDAQMAEDHHLSTEMPTEFEAPEDHDREFEMAPIHCYEDDEHNAPQASATVSRAAITQEFSESDRERLDSMESRVDDAMERLSAAKQSGDADGIADARHSLADANRDFKDYLSDRQDFKADLAEVKNDAQRLVDTDPSDRASAARDFKESYSQANQTIDRMEQEGKPWATDMRRDLQDTAQQFQQQDTEKHGDDGQSNQQTVAATVRETDGLRDDDRIVVVAASPAVMASYQPQQTDEERERDRAQH